MLLLDPVIVWFFVLGYACLLLPAAWHKARDLAVFAAVLDAYRLLPRGSTWLIARLIPLLECGLAVGLCVSTLRVPSAVGVALLMTVYAAAIALNLARGRTDLDCGCTGPLERRPVARWMVYRNLLLALLALVLTQPVQVRALTIVDLVSVAAALATLILLWLASDRLLGQVMPRGALLKVSR